MRCRVVLAISVALLVASCSRASGRGGDATSAAQPSSDTATYVESSTHRAPDRPPTVLAGGVAAKLVHTQWAVEGTAAPSQSADQPDLNALAWPTTASLTSLEIQTARPPAAATINTFANVDANGIPSEREMLTINCVAGSPPKSLVGPGCWIQPSSHEGAVVVTLRQERPDSYVVLWAQWWFWPQGQDEPAPSSVRPVDASWAIAKRTA